MFIIDLEESQALEYGIDVYKLTPKTMIIVATRNSIYKILKGNRDRCNVKIQGGKYLPTPIEANFSGATFGGSIIKPGWIGCGMHLEFYVPSTKKTYISSSIRAAKIIGNGWEYDMEWGSGKIITKPKIKGKEDKASFPPPH
jgi:hypothetical protein